jgi:hypothetical protein
MSDGQSHAKRIDKAFSEANAHSETLLDRERDLEEELAQLRAAESEETQSWRFVSDGVPIYDRRAEAAREGREAAERAVESERRHVEAMARIDAMRSAGEPSEATVRAALMLAGVAGVVSWAIGMCMGALLWAALR